MRLVQQTGQEPKTRIGVAKRRFADVVFHFFVGGDGEFGGVVVGGEFEFGLVGVVGCEAGVNVVA